MLAETFDHLSANGDDRCLVDVGDPQNGETPKVSAMSDVRSADDHYVVGGTAAIPNSWLRAHFDDVSVSRFSGADRWATQAAVATMIVRLANSGAADAFSVAETTSNAVAFEARIDRTTVTVHYCGPQHGSDAEGAWDEQRLRREVGLLNERVKPFFESQFGDSGFTIEFEAGEFLQPTTEPGYWLETRMKNWQDSARDSAEAARESKGEKKAVPSNACESELIARDIDVRSALMLAHIEADCAAYAWSGHGPSVVATRLKHGSCGLGGDYYTVVAHELGHGLYDLPHSWGDASVCQGTHSEHGHILSRDELTSIMSYTWPRGTCDRQAIGAGAHVSCVDRQRQHLQWLTAAGECGQSLRSSEPDAPEQVQLIARDRQLHVIWDPPSSDGGSAIESYEVRFRQAGSRNGWTVFGRVSAGITSATIIGLSNGVEYEVVVRARNGVGVGEDSTSKTETPGSDVATVSLSVGRSAESEPTTSPAGGTCSSRCRWLHVDVDNIVALGPGPHNVVCAHRGIQGAVTYAAGAFNSKQVSSFPVDACFFGFPGATVYVIVGAERVSGGWQGGVRSNDLIWPDCSVDPRRCGEDDEAPTASPLLEAQDGAIGVRLGSSSAFDIQYRQARTTTWRTWNAVTFVDVAGDGTWTSIRNLTNGVSYEVRIRSRDASRDWGWSSPVRETPMGAEPGSPRVTVARGDPGPRTAPRPDSVPCSANSPDCRWLDIRLENFRPGDYRVYCVHDGWNNGEFRSGRFHSFNTTIGNAGSARSIRDCYINVARTDGRGVAIYVGRASQPDGQYLWVSNWLR